MLIQAGCILDQRQRPHTILLFDSFSLSPNHIVVFDGESVEDIPWNGVLRSATFSPLSLGDDGALLVNADSPGDLVVSWLRLQTGEAHESPSLQRIRRDSLYSLPNALLSGDIDGEQRADLLAHIVLWHKDPGFLQTTLAAEHHGERLTGFLLPDETATSIVGTVADFDGNNVDDIAMTVNLRTHQGQTVVQRTRFKFCLMGSND